MPAPGNGLGIGGFRLHEWLGEPASDPPYFDRPGLSGQVFGEPMATGAVVVGRKTFDYAGHWHGDADLRTRAWHPADAAERPGSLRARRRNGDAGTPARTTLGEPA